MNLLAHLKSLPQWPKKQHSSLEPQFDRGYNQALTEIESILAKEDMPERLDKDKLIQIINDWNLENGKWFATLSKFGVMDLAQFVSSKFSAPKTLSLEEIGKSLLFGWSEARRKGLTNIPIDHNITIEQAQALKTALESK